ncbi:MAG: nuclear transport factor 2 family protein [Acidobacteriota bacterium]
MSDTQTLDQALNDAILGGDILGAFETYYADDVVMVEPGGNRREGKAVNREYEAQFVESVQDFHGAEVVASAVAGDVSFSEWTMDITFRDGNRKTLEQVAVRRWQDGRVVQERFYYDTAG